MEKLVVDANIIIAAMLKDGKTRKILLESGLKLFSPDFIKEEIFKHSSFLAGKLRISETEIKELFIEIFETAEIEVVQLEKYSDCIENAIKISPDKKDAPYFALALKLNHPIWSNDKALKKQSRIKVYSTEQLIKEQIIK